MVPRKVKEGFYYRAHLGDTADSLGPPLPEYHLGSSSEELGVLDEAEAAGGRPVLRFSWFMSVMEAVWRVLPQCTVSVCVCVCVCVCVSNSISVQLLLNSESQVIRSKIAWHFSKNQPAHYSHETPKQTLFI